MNSFQKRYSLKHVISFTFFSLTFLVNHVHSIVDTVEVKDDKEFPFQVLISLNNEFMCSGTILDKRTILSVAKCFLDVRERHYNKFEIIAGTAAYDFKQEPVKKEHMQIVKSEKITRHQCYNFKRSEEESKTNKSPKQLYDLALIKLASDLQFNEYVSAIKVNEEPPTIKEPEPNHEEKCKEDDICVPQYLKEGQGIFIGWGKHGNPKHRDTYIYPSLQKALVKFESIDDCLAFLVSNNKTGFEQSLNDKDMICVRFQEKSSGKVTASSDDLGGQLLVQNDGKLELVGLYFYMTGAKGFPVGMFTNVARYTDWIKDPEEPLPCAVHATEEPEETTEEDESSENRLVGDFKIILIPLFLHGLLKI